MSRGRQIFPYFYLQRQLESNMAIYSRLLIQQVKGSASAASLLFLLWDGLLLLFGFLFVCLLLLLVFK